MHIIGDEEIAAIKILFDQKKRLYRYNADESSECDLFEREYSKYIGAEHSLLLSSGTNSLVIALLAGGIQPGDEVLIPAYTFVATATAVLQAGAIPVVVNIDSQLSLDFKEAENLITNKTKALILVHMDGLVANIPAATDFCKKNNLLFVEDVAQAIGATFQGKKLGTFGRFGCYSLNENKNISCGEGGILVTQEKALYETAFCLHDTPAQFNPTKKKFFTEITPFVGFSMRVSEIQGAIMRVQLKRLDFILSELKKCKEIYLHKLQDISHLKIIQGYDPVGECHSSLHLQMPDEKRALEICKKSYDLGITIAPVTSRPAHAVWQWSGLFGKRSHIQKSRNPYTNDQSYSYANFNYLQSIDILMRTLKLDFNIHLDQTEIEQNAEKLRNILLA